MGQAGRAPERVWSWEKQDVAIPFCPSHLQKAQEVMLGEARPGCQSQRGTRFPSAVILHSLMVTGEGLSL
jgi:hypothetical protein